MTFPLTPYIEAALEPARYDKLEDGSFSGEIPKLKGVIAFGIGGSGETDAVAARCV